MFRIAILMLAILCVPARACNDVALVLLADASSSMSASERDVQRKGYADAFRSKQVNDAITSGYCGQIAVTYIEFGTVPFTVVDWTVVKDGKQLADIIETAQPAKINDSNNLTGIANAMRLADSALKNIEADRKVIDVSSDGPDNVTQDTIAVRDNLVSQDVTINGLIVGGGVPYGMTQEELVQYFIDNVVGGPLHFTIKAYSSDRIPEIVRRKLVLEIG